MKIFVFAMDAQNKIKQIYNISKAYMEARISTLHEAGEGRDIANINILGDLATDKETEILSKIIIRSVLQEQLKGSFE